MRGGDCIYALDFGELLREAGHEVYFYAMSYPKNITCEEERYFAEETSFSAASLSGKGKAVGRILWGMGVKQGFERLLNDFRPDVVHLNNVHSYLSPLVAKLAHKRGIKVVWTLHDYKLICPSYNCQHRGKVCEACFTDPKQVVLRKCMKNSLLASLLAWGEILNWNRNKLSAWTDAFICPSRFLAEKMRQGGYGADKLQVISNFIGKEQRQYITETPNPEREQAYAFVGRLSEEKGVASLLRAASRLPYKLYVAGTGPQEAALKKKYASEQIVFLGHLEKKEVIELLKKVCFTVIPSVCYENNPLSVIESLCCGTPVLGRKIGGIPELLEPDGCNRFFVEDKELPACIAEMFEQAAATDRDRLSAASLHRFSGEQYYQKWMEVVK